MTRETKIGLLVGLCFIVVIGVLLSDHLSTSSADPQAQLAGAGANVRDAVRVPAAVGQPQPIVVPGPGSQSVPQNPVPTGVELNRPTETAQIVVGPGGSTAKPLSMQEDRSQQASAGAAGTGGLMTLSVTTGQQQQEPSVTTYPPAGSGRGAPGPTVAMATDPLANDPLMVRSDQAGQQGTAGSQQQQAAAAGGAAKVLKSYKVEAGDSVSKIAKKFYGSNGKSYIDAIVAANPSLKGDATRLAVGRTYVIPAVDKAGRVIKGDKAEQQATPAPQQQQQPKSAAAGTVAPAPAAPIASTLDLPATSSNPTPAGGTGAPSLATLFASNPTPTAASTTATPKGSTAKATGSYTAKDGDTLWKIAAKQMGDGSQWKELKELNRDVLKGGETVRPGMVLKVPGKTVSASAR